jgi:catechol 2,3-dioxygenase-like lactoylglutathione lyase family enzyme
MKDWYQAVLSLTPAYEYMPPDWNARRGDHHDFLATLASPVRLCFLRLHSDYPYTQVVALFEIASSRRAEDSAGLHHFQFRQASLDDLFLRFERLREVGVVPVRCMDHGPSTSFYYEDPDGNFVELSATNFEHESDYVAFFGSAAFAANPGGVTIEPADYISAHRKAEGKSGTPCC